MQIFEAAKIHLVSLLMFVHMSIFFTGCSVLPSGYVQWYSYGQCKGLGMGWAGVARSGPLRLITHNEPGKTLNRSSA